MKLLIRDKQAVFAIGLGLVGSAVCQELTRRFTVAASEKLNWSSADDCVKTLQSVLKKHLPKDIEKVDIIWSAGKTGFLAGPDDIKTDMAFFENFNSGFLKAIHQWVKSANIRYLLISSAGGLFEGQTNVGHSSKAETKRPYGELKLAQENWIANHPKIDKHSCLRLSSVYTVSNLSSRLGLIPTIMSRALRQDVVTIFGTEMTLRDYVLDKDIGRYVAANIEKDFPETAFIVDGKPYSILEIKGLIERITGKKVYLKYTLMKTNAANISFSTNVRAAGFKASDLKTNLRVLYDNLSTGNQI